MLGLALALTILTQGHITVQGRTRDFLVYAPPSARAAAPVIFLLHGRLGTDDGMVKLADFRAIADREGIILVYPQGIDRSWNDGRLRTPAHKQGVDDVAFIDQLITYITKNYPADPQRIYVAGMSNGGFMTSRLGCDLPARIAAIAVVAASTTASCKAKGEIPVMYIQGTRDPIVPYDGKDDMESHEQAIRYWVTKDNCDPKGRASQRPDSAGDGTAIERTVYTNPGTRVQVADITVVNGGHAWPGGWPYLPKAIIGVTSRNLDANEVIWDFFRQFRREIPGD